MVYALFTLETRSISARLLVNAFTIEREVNRICRDRGEAHALGGVEFANPSFYANIRENVVVITKFALLFLGHSNYVCAADGATTSRIDGTETKSTSVRNPR